MSPLKYIQLTLTLIGVCATNDDVGSVRKCLNMIVYSILIGMHLLNLCPTSLYFIKYVSVDYEGGIFALMETTVVFCNVWTLMSSFWSRDKIRDTFATFESIRVGSTIE